jgi:hypothetical protein
MTEKVKLTKATAKPPKATTKKKAVAAPAKATAPSPEEIKQLAEKYWAGRGYKDGFAEQDWLKAEQELRKKAS